MCLDGKKAEAGCIGAFLIWFFLFSLMHLLYIGVVEAREGKGCVGGMKAFFWGGLMGYTRHWRDMSVCNM